MQSLSLRPVRDSSPIMADPLLQKNEAILTAEKQSLDKNLVTGLVNKSNRILASISSHKFPFDFFMNKLLNNVRLLHPYARQQ